MIKKVLLFTNLNKSNKDKEVKLLHLILINKNNIQIITNKINHSIQLK